MKTMMNSPRGVGRPREFDADAVLDAAIRQFTLEGYHGSSVTALSKATGLTAGSLYKAYTDKRGLFRAALSRYISVNNQRLEAALRQAGSGLQQIQILLAHYIANSTGDSGRTGCLVVASAIELSATDTEIAEQTAALMERYRQRFIRCLQQGIGDGSITPSVSPQAMASLLLSATQGMRVLGKSGLTSGTAAETEQMLLNILQP